MQLEAIEKNLQIYIEKKGDDVLIQNREAAKHSKNLMLKRKDVRPLRILLDSIIDDEPTENEPENKVYLNCADCKFSENIADVKTLCCVHPERRLRGLEANYHTTQFLRTHHFCGYNAIRFEGKGEND